MGLFNRQQEASPIPEEPAYGLSRDELNERMADLYDGSGLAEEFSDGELWPTAGLSDRQVELLSGKLREIRDKGAKK